jgi:hypothetical protein
MRSRSSGKSVGNFPKTTETPYSKHLVRGEVPALAPGMTDAFMWPVLPAEFSDRMKIDLYCDLVFHVAYISVTYACARNLVIGLGATLTGCAK